MHYSLFLVPAAGLALLLLERLFPLRRARRPFAARFLVNAIVSASALAIALLLVKPVGIAALQFASENEWGLTQLVSNAAAQAIVAFLLMDLSFYYWHRANHAWPFLWRFHNTHHLDPDLDVSTAVRFHVVEVGFSAAFRGLQVILIGAPAWVFVAYETMFQLNTLFHHSNVRLPIGVERYLNLLIVTPRMHGIHHSKRFHEANSNWSSVFPWWDLLHGTLRLNVPQSAIDVGVSGYSLAKDNTVQAVFTIPFRRQRDYWQGQHGAELLEQQGAGKRTRLAE